MLTFLLEQDVPEWMAREIAAVGAMPVVTDPPCRPGMIYTLAGQRFVVTGETTEEDFLARAAAAGVAVRFARRVACRFVLVSTD